MGCVYKLGKNRRRPYAARITKEFDEFGKQIYEFLGTFETQQEALNVLNDYIDNPYDINNLKITFKDVFCKFKKEKYPTLSEESIKGYETSYKKCKDLYDVKMKDIRLSHLQGVIDDSNNNYPMKSKLRVLLRQVSKYAYKNDIIRKDYSMYINIGPQNEVEERKPFTKEHRQLLWDNIDVEWVSSILVLIYTGFRVNELLDIEIQNVHLDEDYPYLVGGNKSVARQTEEWSQYIGKFFQ